MSSAGKIVYAIATTLNQIHAASKKYQFQISNILKDILITKITKTNFVHVNVWMVFDHSEKAGLKQCLNNVYDFANHII